MSTVNKIRNMLTIGAAAAAVLAAVPSFVSAQEIVISGEKCPLTLVEDRQAYTADHENAIVETVVLDNFDLLGVIDDAYVAIMFNGGRGFVPISEIEEKIPSVDLSSMTQVSSWQDLTRGSSGDLTRSVQEALNALKYNAGEADGAFGEMTAEAIAAFQTDNGLEATGVADPFTCLLLLEKAIGEKESLTVEYPPVYRAEDKFAAIIADVEDPSVLEAYLDPSWKFTYDVMEGTGEISKGEHVGSFEDYSRQIDRISISVDKTVYVGRNDRNLVDVAPVLLIKSVGAYRPYMLNVIIRSGNHVEELPVIGRTGELQGTDVSETAYAQLTEEAEALLAESGVEIRLEGSSKNYDIDAGTMSVVVDETETEATDSDYEDAEEF